MPVPTVRKSRTTRVRPPAQPDQVRPLVARMNLNGLVAIVLFDSGSTSDAISPDFARVANLKVFALTEPVPIQLGCRGSRSKIIYGTNCPVQYEGVDQRHYFDIVNVDRFDAIIGIGFMRQFGITLDPGANQILIRGKAVPTLSEGEEQAEIARRQSLRKQFAAPSE